EAVRGHLLLETEMSLGKFSRGSGIVDVERDCGRSDAHRFPIADSMTGRAIAGRLAPRREPAEVERADRGRSTVHKGSSLIAAAVWRFIAVAGVSSLRMLAG